MTQNTIPINAALSHQPGDSDPDMDEALRRVRTDGLSLRGVAALGRLTANLAYDLRARQTAEADRREIAEVAA